MLAQRKPSEQSDSAFAKQRTVGARTSNAPSIENMLRSQGRGRRASTNTQKTTLNSEIRSLERKMTMKSNLLRKQTNMLST